MILRMIVSAINPYKKKGIFRNKPFLLRCQKGLFSFSIKCMQNLYRRYAYHDSINLGGIRIVQTCRDEVFEGWLKKIGLDVKPHFSSNKPYPKDNNKEGSLKPFYKFFKFKRQLIVNNSGKELLIDRSAHLSIYNEIKGTLNISDETDILLRTEFKSAFKIQNAVSVKETVKDEPPKEPIQEMPPKRRDKVSLGKPSIKTTPPIVEPPAVEPPVKEDTGRKMRGVEIDESF